MGGYPTHRLRGVGVWVRRGQNRQGVQIARKGVPKSAPQARFEKIFAVFWDPWGVVGGGRKGNLSRAAAKILEFEH